MGEILRLGEGCVEAVTNSESELRQALKGSWRGFVCKKRHRRKKEGTMCLN